MGLLELKEWPKASDGSRYLCVIREREGNREHGFLLENSWDVFLGYIWDGGNGNTISYSSEQEVLAAGWQVD